MASPRTTPLQLRRVLPALAALKALLAHLVHRAYESVFGVVLSRPFFSRSLCTCALVFFLPVAQANPSPPQPLSRVAGLSAVQITTLQREGIKSLASLASAKPEMLAKALKVDEKQAAVLINQAQFERTRLGRSLAASRDRFKLPPITVAGSYASLITPTNECTLLVRKVCGLQNQCGGGGGACSVTMSLLQRYNAGGPEGASSAESCLMALEDPLLFAQCAP